MELDSIVDKSCLHVSASKIRLHVHLRTTRLVRREVVPRYVMLAEEKYMPKHAFSLVKTKHS